MSEIKKTCYNCGYRGNVPGSAHSTCSFNFKKAEVDVPKGNPHGIKNGWYYFPINFDPVWIIKECSAFSIEKDNEMVIDPVFNLFQMLKH